jgi:hypothetical protein
MEVRERETTDQDRALIEKWASELPEHLHKYRALGQPYGRDRLEGIVQGSALYFPTFASLNDPFDSVFSFDYTASPEVIDAHWRRQIPEGTPGREEGIANAIRMSQAPAAQAHIERELIERFSSQGVCCFGLKPDDLLMWSYYSEGHSGVCLRFRAAELFDTYCVERGILVPVEYHSSYPTPRFYEGGYVYQAQVAIGSKSERWRHEGEWRIVLPEESGVQLFPPRSLDAMIVGCRISPDDEDFVRELARRRGVPVMRAEKIEREYGLNIEPSTGGG